MSITVVNDWRFKPDGDIEKGMRAAEEYVDYLMNEADGVQLSLWLRHPEDPQRFFHITVFDDEAAVKAQYESDGTKRFTEVLYPEIIYDESFTSPWCDVVLSSGGTLPRILLQPLVG
jgi:quinol monooxygenase YgiN